MVSKVLFLCTHNSARSQIAEGLVNALFSDKFSASSAGTMPRTVDPHAMQVMKEIGIDISKQRSKHIEELSGQHFDVVVTLCDSAVLTCPLFPGDRIVHKPFPDPAADSGTEKEKLERFKKTRNDIERWLRAEIPKW